MLFLSTRRLGMSGSTLRSRVSSTVSSLGGSGYAHIVTSIGEHIWGRGSCDDKAQLVGTMSVLTCQCCVNSRADVSPRAAVELLLQKGYKPTRSIVLAYGFDEERGGLHVRDQHLFWKPQSDCMGLIRVPNISPSSYSTPMAMTASPSLLMRAGSMMSVTTLSSRCPPLLRRVQQTSTSRSLRPAVILVFLPRIL